MLQWHLVKHRVHDGQRHGWRIVRALPAKGGWRAPCALCTILSLLMLKESTLATAGRSITMCLIDQQLMFLGLYVCSAVVTRTQSPVRSLAPQSVLGARRLLATRTIARTYQMLGMAMVDWQGILARKVGHRVLDRGRAGGISIRAIDVVTNHFGTHGGAASR